MKFHLSEKEFALTTKRHVPVRLQSPQQLQITLGESLQTLRLRRNQRQRDLATAAGVSEKAIRNLEGGRGSTVQTFLRVMKALDSLQVIESIAPYVSVDPLALLVYGRPRERARKVL